MDRLCHLFICLYVWGKSLARVKCPVVWYDSGTGEDVWGKITESVYGELDG